MGVLDRFEKGVQETVASIFSRAFKAELKPVDITSAIHREMDDRAASLGKGRTVAPNVFDVELSDLDYENSKEWGIEELSGEFENSASEHAQDQGYALLGPLDVSFTSAVDLERGKLRIRSSSRRGPDPSAPHAQEAVTTPTTLAQARAAMQAAEAAGQSNQPPPSPTPSLPAHPVLEVNGQRYLLTGPITIIGRGSESDIIVEDTGVSRKHLEIRVTSQGTVATDLGSTNGTFVEGHQTPAATLVNGNTLNIGRTTIIYWESAAAIG